MMARIIQPAWTWIVRRPAWALQFIAVLPFVILLLGALISSVRDVILIFFPLAIAWACFIATVCLVGNLLAWRDAYILHAIDSMDKLSNLRSRDFENLVAGIFRQKGYRIKHLHGDSSDREFDLLLTNKNQENVAVRCIFNRYDPVDIKDVRELHDVIKSRRIPHAYIVTTTDFTEDAEKFADEKQSEIALINGKKLYKLIQDVRRVADDPMDSIVGRLLTISPGLKPPTCPECGTDMKLCKTKRGRRFWGCSNWPVCRGKRGLTKHEYEVLRRSNR